MGEGGVGGAEGVGEREDGDESEKGEAGFYGVSGQAGRGGSLGFGVCCARFAVICSLFSVCGLGVGGWMKQGGGCGVMVVR